VIRGERPIKRRDSWFFAKPILVGRFLFVTGVEPLDKVGRFLSYQT